MKPSLLARGSDSGSPIDPADLALTTGLFRYRGAEASGETNYYGGAGPVMYEQYVPLSPDLTQGNSSRRMSVVAGATDGYVLSAPTASNGKYVVQSDAPTDFTALHDGTTAYYISIAMKFVSDADVVYEMIGTRSLAGFPGFAVAVDDSSGKTRRVYLDVWNKTSGQRVVQFETGDNAIPDDTWGVLSAFIDPANNTAAAWWNGAELTGSNTGSDAATTDVGLNNFSIGSSGAENNIGPCGWYFRDIVCYEGDAATRAGVELWMTDYYDGMS